MSNEASAALNTARSESGGAGAWPVETSAAKRTFDVTVALVLAVVLSPLFGLIALLIVLDSSGGPIFRQERVGLKGVRFFMLKFRTMRRGASPERHRQYVLGLVNGDAEHSHNGVYKLVADDRVTRIGALLRRTSLDELPQLWNVLKGEMSLIGPRPPLPYEVDVYDAEQMRRLECRPGVTGLWQVSGRNRLSYREMCELDVRYIEDWSFWHDMKILARTVPVVFTNSGHAR